MKCQHARVELELEHRPVYVRHSGEWERELEELVNAPAHETRRCDHVTHWTCHLRSACSESMFRGVNGDGDDCYSAIHTHTHAHINHLYPSTRSIKHTPPTDLPLPHVIDLINAKKSFVPSHLFYFCFVWFYLSWLVACRSVARMDSKDSKTDSKGFRKDRKNLIPA